MPVKITKRITANVMWERSKREFHRLMRLGGLVERIKELILKGISPVAGKKFPKYSTGYIDTIQRSKGDFKSKKQSPVNLFLSGDMMRSLEADGSDIQTFVKFKDEKAEWHNNGMGRLPERRILPDRQGEKWHRSVTEYLSNSLREALRKYFK